MGIVKTMLVTFIKGGSQAVINASDFDPALHRKGDAKPLLKKKASFKTGGLK